MVGSHNLSRVTIGIPWNFAKFYELVSIRQVDQQNMLLMFFCKAVQKTRWAKGVLVDSWQDTEQLKLVLLPMSWSALQKKIRHIVDWSPNNRVAVYIFYHIILIYTLQICLNFTF